MAKILSAVSALIVRGYNGEISWEETGEAILAALQADLAEVASHDAAIEAALDRLYDRVPAGTAIRTPIVVQAVAAELAGGDFLRMTETTALVEAYLDRSVRFVGQRGRNGGLKRVG